MRFWFVILLLLLGVIVVGFAISTFGESMSSSKQLTIPANATNTSSDQTEKVAVPERIVSMAPAITETLYELNQGVKVVGVTAYCTYPIEATKKPKVGGLLDPNYEALLRLQPDLVMCYPEHTRPVNRLEKLQLKTLILEHNTLSEIVEMILQVGKACHVEDHAKELVNKMQAEIDTIESATEGLPQPTVLICLDRVIGNGKLQDVYVVGPGGFYEELLLKANAKNAYNGPNISFPKLSQEGILKLNPDIIFDFVGGVQHRNQEQELVKDWQQVAEVSAVKNNRVYVFTNNHLMRPGPRIVNLLRVMAIAIHPQLAETLNASTLSVSPNSTIQSSEK